RAEPVEVEVRVARDERVEGPVDAPDADGAAGVALVLLEPASQSGVVQLGSHRKHVRPVYELAVLHTGHAEDEAEQAPRLVECAGGHAADALRHLEDRGRNPLAERGAPGGLLKLDAGGVFLGRREWANVDPRRVAAGDRRGAAGVAGREESHARKLCGATAGREGVRACRLW